MSDLNHRRLVLRLLRNGRWAWLAPLVVLAGLWLPGIWQGGFRTDTHVYTAVTCALHDGLWEGTWLGPRIGNAPYMNKPPMGFYLAWPWVALAGGAGDVDRLIIAVRFSTLLSLAVATVATVRLWSGLAGLRTGAVAGLILVLTAEFFRYGRAFSLDAHLVMFMTLGLWAHATAVRCAGGASTRKTAALIAVGGVAIGFGLLVKPFVALLAPAIAATWAAIALRGSSRGRAIVAAGLLAAVGVLVAAPWHTWMMVHVDGFGERYFFHQSLERATGESFGNTPWHYYPRTLVSTYQPWLVGLLAAGIVVASRRRVSAVLTGPNRHDRQIGTARGPRAAAWLAFVWIIIWIAVLTAFADKRARYLVPMYPASSLLISGVLLCWTGRSGRRVAELARVYVPAVVAALGCGALTLSASGLLRVHAPATPWKIDITAELRERGLSERTWIYPGAARHGASIYVFTGAPPSLIDEEAGRTPAPGDAVLIARESGVYAGEEAWIGRATFVGEFDRFRLYIAE